MEVFAEALIDNNAEILEIFQEKKKYNFFENSSHTLSEEIFNINTITTNPFGENRTVFHELVSRKECTTGMVDLLVGKYNFGTKQKWRESQEKPDS